MDYKDKYNKLVEAIKVLQETNQSDEGIQNWVKDNVPELRESEDEKIMKNIKRAISVALDYYYAYFDKETANNCLAWLEKQGTSYTKRDVDDAFVEGMVFAKNELEKQGKQILSNSVKTCKDEQKPALDIEIPFGAKDSELQEAIYLIPKGFHAEIKDNEVLIKKGKKKSITFNNAHVIDSSLNDYCCKQYDALHKENGGVLSFARLQHLAMDIYGWCKEQGKQKPAWTESDDEELEIAINTLKDAGQYGSADWVKSLKDRVRPKQEWSEEDELQMQGIIDLLPGLTIRHNWLKSIKQRHVWKPTKKQMAALHDMNLIGNISYAGQGQTLIELYNDLKKL